MRSAKPLARGIAANNPGGGGDGTREAEGRGRDWCAWAKGDAVSAVLLPQSWQQTPLGRLTPPTIRLAETCVLAPAAAVIRPPQLSGPIPSGSSNLAPSVLASQRIRRDEGRKTRAKAETRSLDLPLLPATQAADAAPTMPRLKHQPVGECQDETSAEPSCIRACVMCSPVRPMPTTLPAPCCVGSCKWTRAPEAGPLLGRSIIHWIL